MHWSVTVLLTLTVLASAWGCCSEDSRQARPLGHLVDPALAAACPAHVYTTGEGSSQVAYIICSLDGYDTCISKGTTVFSRYGRTGKLLRL